MSPATVPASPSSFNKAKANFPPYKPVTEVDTGALPSKIPNEATTSAAFIFLVRSKDKHSKRYFILESDPETADSFSLPQVSRTELAAPSSKAFGPLGTIAEEDVIDLVPKIVRAENFAFKEQMEAAKYSGPGAENGYLKTFLLERSLDRVEIQELKKKLDGQNGKLKILGIDEDWEQSPNNAKAIAVWALYELLNKAGML